MIGRRRDRAKASAACCETVSVLIMLPMDMKNLEDIRASVVCLGLPRYQRMRTQRLPQIQAYTVLVSSLHRSVPLRIS